MTRKLIQTNDYQLDSESKYRQLFNFCTDALVVIDSRTRRVLDVNSAALKMYGYSRDEFFQMQEQDLYDRLQLPGTAISRYGQSTGTCHYRRKDGTTFPVNIISRHFLWDGNVVCLVAIRDITEMKQAEQIQYGVLAYEELDNLKQNILSTVSHELRTPLAIIKGYSSLMLEYFERLAQEERQDYLAAIDRATNRLTGLVEHLLDMSRLDAGLLRMDRLPTEIRPLLEMAVKEAAVRAPTHSIEIKGFIPDVLLDMDGRRIRQVVDNLIDNALKYSSPGSNVSVSAGRRDRDILFSITDEGAGIESGDLDKVFDRMYRIEQRLAEHLTGLGLGLALCKALVEAHSGCIWAESTVGQGSTFYFTIPLYIR